MSLKLRTLLTAIVPLALGLIGTATALAWTGRRSLRAQSEEDASVIANLLARCTEYAGEVQDEVEEIVGDQMVAQATIAAYMVALAEQAGLSPEEISDRLKQIADHTVVNEFWITEEHGRAYLRNNPTEFTFSPDAKAEPQASAFWPLLTGDKKVVVQKARKREIDNRVFKFAGVAGVDRPRIVQVGIGEAYFDKLNQRMGLRRLVEDLVRGGNILGLRVVDQNLNTLASNAQPSVTISPELSPSEKALLQEVVGQRRTVTTMEDTILKAIAPIATRYGKVVGAVIVYLPAERVEATMGRSLPLAAAAGVASIAAGMLVSIVLARRVA